MLLRQQRPLHCFGLINGTVVTRRTEGSVVLTEGSAAGRFVGGAFTVPEILSCLLAG
jgi:hypothetical protein